MIKIENIHKYYLTTIQPLHVLKGVNRKVKQSEMMYIMGLSGSRKSTLLNILELLHQYDEGNYYFNNNLLKNLTEREAAVYRNKYIGFVFQSFNLIEYKNALENIALPFLLSKSKRKRTGQNGFVILGSIRIKRMVASRPSGLSGGQKQHD